MVVEARTVTATPPHGSVGLLRVVRAFVARDLRILRTYRLQLVGQVLGLALSLLSIGFLARVVPANQASLQPFGGDYFTFVLLGTGAATFFQTGIGTFSDGLRSEQAQGTLEALLATPNDPRTLLLSGAAWPFLFGGITLGLYLAAGGLVFGAHIALVRVPLLLAVMVLTLAAFSTLGMLAAAVLVLVKRGSMVVTLLTAAFGLFGGVMYPVSVLPVWLQGLAALLPMTYGLDAARHAVAPSLDAGRLGLDVTALAGFVAILLPLSLAAMRWSVDRARRQGTLAQY